MSTLHVLSHSPFADNHLSSCLRVLGPEDAVLLCGDAVYALREDCVPFKALEALNASRELFVLEEDLQARGLSVPGWILSVDYPGFVALSVRFDKVNTWL